MEHLIEAPQELPVIGKYDVLVSGGGPAGVSAAVAAARAGAKVALVERYGYLGGQATGGLVILLVGLTDGHNRIIKGICQEMINKLEEKKATKDVYPHILFDPEALKLVYDEMITENNIDLYYHNFVSNVITAENRAIGAVIDGKLGRRVIKAKVFVDATADADLAKYCNLPFHKENSDKLMPITLGFRVGGIDIDRILGFYEENNDQYQKLINNLGITTNIGGWIPTLHNNEAWFNISHIENIDGTSTEDLTRAEIQGRKQIEKIMETFKKNIPGFEEGYLIDTASQIGVRETRRIIGVHNFSRDDIARNFDDTIAKAPNYTGAGPGAVNIPYNCLISKKSRNVIFAGRCISVDHELINMFREIPCCMATGQAAGVAAAIASQNEEDNVNVQKININILREILLHQKAEI